MKIAKLRFQYYSAWFIVNFVICLLPILIASAIEGTLKNDIFLSIVSYSYTLIISGLYLYEYVKTQENGQFLNWSSYSAAITLIVFYCIFPIKTNTKLNLLIETNLNSIAIFILILSILLSLFLNRKEIESKITKTLDEEKMKKSQAQTNSFQQLLTDVGNEL